MKECAEPHTTIGSRHHAAGTKPAARRRQPCHSTLDICTPRVVQKATQHTHRRFFKRETLEASRIRRQTIRLQMATSGGGRDARQAAPHCYSWQRLPSEEHWRERRLNPHTADTRERKHHSGRLQPLHPDFRAHRHRTTPVNASTHTCFTRDTCARLLTAAARAAHTNNLNCRQCSLTHAHLSSMAGAHNSCTHPAVNTCRACIIDARAPTSTQHGKHAAATTPQLLEACSTPCTSTAPISGRWLEGCPRRTH